MTTAEQNEWMLFEGDQKRLELVDLHDSYGVRLEWFSELDFTGDGEFSAVIDTITVSPGKDPTIGVGIIDGTYQVSGDTVILTRSDEAEYELKLIESQLVWNDYVAFVKQ